MAQYKSNHADEAGQTRLSAANEARFRAWAAANGISDFDNPNEDHRAYWLAYVAKETDAFEEDERQDDDDAPAGSSRGGRWVARTFLSGKGAKGASRLEAALLKRHRSGARG